MAKRTDLSTERYQSVDDILNHSEHFHRELSQYYHHRARASDSPRSTMMFDYLSRREHDLAVGLRRYRNDAEHSLLTSWLDHVPELDSLPLLDEVTHDCDQVHCDGAADLALIVDQRLMDLYSALTEQAAIERVAELFQNLAEQQSGEQRQLQMARLRLDDL